MKTLSDPIKIHEQQNESENRYFISHNILRDLKSLAEGITFLSSFQELNHLCPTLQLTSWTHFFLPTSSLNINIDYTAVTRIWRFGKEMWLLFTKPCPWNRSTEISEWQILIQHYINYTLCAPHQPETPTSQS